MKKHVALFSSTLMMSTTLLGAGSVFAASESTNATPATAETPVQAVLELPDGGGTNPTPPSPVEPEEPENPGNKPNDPTGAFGIAYQPNKFEFKATKLNESGTQSIALAEGKGNADTFHLGVKDKTRDTKGWSVQAQLTGDITSQRGVTIKMTGSRQVKVNKGNELINAPEGSATGFENISVGSSAVNVMQGNAGQIHNDVYDWGLGTVTMEIADAGQVQAGSHSGSLNWNLSQTPGN